jgi:hypothetical protein
MREENEGGITEDLGEVRDYNMTRRTEGGGEEEEEPDGYEKHEADMYT